MSKHWIRPADLCVCCGAPIPEGRMVCPDCESAARRRSIPAGCRPCEVDGKPAVFHAWVEEEKGVLAVDAWVEEEKGVLAVDAFIKAERVDCIRRTFESDGIVAPGCHLEKLRKTLALIEWPGGTVEAVAPGMIRFTDREG